MTLEEQIMKLQTYKMFEGEDTIYVERDDVLKLLEQQPCEDAISRQAVLDCLTATKLKKFDFILQAREEIKKLPPVTPQQEMGRWIPVSERLPEEHEWIGTAEFGTTISDEVYVTFESPKGERFTKHLSFQNGKVSNFVQSEIDAFHKGSVPIAWMPLPQPYMAESEDKE